VNIVRVINDEDDAEDSNSFMASNQMETILKEAVIKATKEAPLRHNSVETFDEYNTGKNVGKGTPTVFWEIVPNSLYSFI